LPNSLWPIFTRSAPMASLTTLALSAPKKIRSPSWRRSFQDGVQRGIVQVLDDGRLQAVTALGLFVDLDVGQALGAVDGDELGVGVDFRTRHVGTARHAQADHAAVRMLARPRRP
jgi:hypothetical protein